MVEQAKPRSGGKPGTSSGASIAHLLRNLLRPGYAPVMLGKLGRRLLDLSRRADGKDAAAWCRQHAGGLAAMTTELDPRLWAEAQRAGAELRRRAGEVLASVPVPLGGGGHYELLYFLTRLLAPAVVVETGVAAGFSSQAILQALEVNGHGHLYSTDFPYFRLAEPERYVGLLVDDTLRHRWTLYNRGDRDGLARIAAQVSRVDLFHYDSDKRYSGRAAALAAVGGLLDADSLMVMDDAGDDGFFRDWVADRGLPWRVFDFEGKYVGLAGRLAGQRAQTG